MPLHQWRRIFRLIFPNSADAEFADRVFYVIAGDKTKKLITFEVRNIFNGRAVLKFDYLEHSEVVEERWLGEKYVLRVFELNRLALGLR